MALEKNAIPAVSHVTVDERRSGQRLDNFLIAVLKGVPRTHIYRILRRGEVRINRARAKPDYRLKPGDVVRLPPVRTRPMPPSTMGGEGFSWIEQRVLYEDDALLILDKPSGLAVHGGSGIGVNLIDGVRALRASSGAMLELAHRLDRETSGCLLVAKSRVALLGLHEQLREGEVIKEYVALVQGVWHGGPRHVDLALTRSGFASGDRKVRAGAEGKASSTRFTPMRRFGGAALVRARLDTGRTHQVRVHAQAIGHPVAGDAKYGDATFNGQMRGLGLKRLFLHAERLSLHHPVSGASLTVRAPLPPELSAVLERIPP
ncbi:MAG: RluA family pseudouridine synthase [Acidiferrobacteraceae bacterium]